MNVETNTQLVMQEGAGREREAGREVGRGRQEEGGKEGESLYRVCKSYRWSEGG